jgi:hypothetical protein
MQASHLHYEALALPAKLNSPNFANSTPASRAGWLNSTFPNFFSYGLTPFG